MTQFMGNAEFFEAPAGNISSVHSAELIAGLHQHPRNTIDAIWLWLHYNAFARCYVHRINTQSLDLHFAQNKTGGPFRQRFPRESGFAAHSFSLF
jgi:hypothetical protein